MITNIVIDETVDDEVFCIEFTDGPFHGLIEADWDLDPGEWLLPMGWVKGTEYLDHIMAMDEIDTPLKFFDPRFMDDLLNSPVTKWYWGNQSSTI